MKAPQEDEIPIKNPDGTLNINSILEMYNYQQISNNIIMIYKWIWNIKCRYKRLFSFTYISML